MFSTIQGRLKFILGTSMLLVAIMGAVSLYYFAAISEDLELVIGSDIQWERRSQEVRRLYTDLNQNKKQYLSFSDQKEAEATLEILSFQRVMASIELLQQNIDKYLQPKNNLRPIDPEIENKLKELKGRFITLKQSFDHYANFLKNEKKVQLTTTKESLEKQFETIKKDIEDFREFIGERVESHQEDMGRVLSNARRNIVLLISLSAIALFMIFYMAPQKVVQPIRKYISALKELRDLKFDVRLPTHGKNELTELGFEINSFIDEFLEFDTMKVKKIQFEKRKLQVLADILNFGVIVVSVEGGILFMNTQMAKFLNLSSEDFHKKDFHFVRLSEELKELFDEALEKKEKFENRMMFLTYTKTEEDGQTHDEAVELLVDAGMVRNYVGEVANVVFTFEDITNSPEDSIFQRISFKNKESS